MWEIDWSDAHTFWLNVTNIGLGVVCLGLFLAIVHTIIREWFFSGRAERRRRSQQ